MSELTFTQLAEANRSRAMRWHPGFPADDDWNGADWSNAMCGEAGEAANIVKKLRREDTGKVGVSRTPRPELLRELGYELADLIIYADLVAAKYDLDLAGAIVEKFNAVSDLHGFPECLSDHVEAKSGKA